MLINRAQVINFGSYESLNIDFTNQGLTLISGPTGSGKSTLCDIIPWILFGRTAKDGAVDEIRPWNCKDTTKGTLLLDNATIVRTRAPNDLYILRPGGEPIRGKDLSDTQKIINDFIGLDLEAYLLSSYFHEFSSISSFFTTTAKNRRQITEQIVDLSMAKKIQEAGAEYRKNLTAELDKLASEEKALNGLIQQSSNHIVALMKKSHDWNDSQAKAIKDAKLAVENYDSDKQKRLKAIQKQYVNDYAELEEEKISLELSTHPVEVLKRADLELRRRKDGLKDTLCPTCGNHLDTTPRMLLAKDEAAYNLQLQNNDQAQAQLTKLEKKLVVLKGSLKPRLDREEQHLNSTSDHLKALEAQTNPYIDMILKLTQESQTLIHTQKEMALNLNLVSQELSDLKLLVKVVDEFRSTLITNTLEQVETTTNKYLESHFDAEIKVKFVAEQADKIEVEVYKDGNLASFTQLSKGQRQLLKLTFAVSIMKAVSNLRGVSLNTAFLDEGLDGFDSDLKIKAFGLLQELALTTESVFVVEHSQDLKLLFSNSINVVNSNGKSTVE